MHSPPSTPEKYLYLNSSRRLIYGFGFVSMLFLFCGNLIFIYYNPIFFAYLIFVLITFFYLVLSYLVGFAGDEFDFKLHQSRVSRWIDWASTASVDIFLPVCGEPVDIIRNTWDHVKKLRAHHESAIGVYVLDDGKSDEIKLLATHYGFSYIRRETNELKKAGNLRTAFAQTSGEFILILDADFCPREDFLIETLPYMFEDYRCAVVGTPQYFTADGHKTWVGKGAAVVQELFYRLIQVSRNSFNASVCTGTNTLYRRSALSEFGGTAAMPYSEDMHTGFNLISTGWKINYIPINLCMGICPDDLKSFFVQQMRWSMGSIYLFFSQRFWTANITMWQRVCYLTGIGYYISTALSVVFAPLPGLYMMMFYPEKIIWYNLLFTIPSLIFGYVFIPIWLKAPFGLYLPRSRQVSYFSHMFALKDFLMNTLEEWIPTGDAASKSKRYDSFRASFVCFCVVPQMLMMVLLATRLVQGYNPLNFIFVLMFILLNVAITFPIIKETLGDGPVAK